MSSLKHLTCVNAENCVKHVTIMFGNTVSKTTNCNIMNSAPLMSDSEKEEFNCVISEVCMYLWWPFFKKVINQPCINYLEHKTIIYDDNWISPVELEFKKIDNEDFRNLKFFIVYDLGGVLHGIYDEDAESCANSLLTVLD